MNINLASYDTDKSATYLNHYELEFGRLFDQPIALLELGIQRGGSMYLWRDLLPNAQIAGLDLNEIPIEDETGRLHIYQGFQQDRKILDQIGSDVAPQGFDVIVDDASHLGKYTAESFWHLFANHLKPGGIYVIDDWACGYWNEWSDGHAFTGDRATIGDFATATGDALSDAPGTFEQLRRKVRARARPLAANLSPTTRQRLERIYMRAEGVSVQKRFKSHDYGMVGFVKQLVDACAVNAIDRGSFAFDNGIASVHVYESQVFVHKKEQI